VALVEYRQFLDAEPRPEQRPQHRVGLRKAAPVTPPQLRWNLEHHFALEQHLLNLPTSPQNLRPELRCPEVLRSESSCYDHHGIRDGVFLARYRRGLQIVLETQFHPDDPIQNYFSLRGCLEG
jgi:hypothetical protein